MNAIKGDINIPIFLVETILGIGVTGLIFLGIIAYNSSVVYDTSSLLRKAMITDDLIHLFENCLKSDEPYIRADLLDYKLDECKFKYFPVNWVLISAPAIEPIEIGGCVMAGGIECGRTAEGYINYAYIEVMDMETGRIWKIGERTETGINGILSNTWRTGGAETNRFSSNEEVLNSLFKKKEIFVNIKVGNEIHLGKIYLEVISESD